MYACISALHPDIMINAGTAGGFKAKGACLNDVFLASEVAFHDRRIPIPVFDLYGVGLRQACQTPNLAKELGLKTLNCLLEILLTCLLTTKHLLLQTMLQLRTWREQLLLMCLRC